MWGAYWLNSAAVKPRKSFIIAPGPDSETLVAPVSDRHAGLASGIAQRIGSTFALDQACRVSQPPSTGHCIRL